MNQAHITTSMLAGRLFVLVGLVVCPPILAVGADVSLDLTTIAVPPPFVSGSFGGQLDLGDANGDGVLDMVVTQVGHNLGQGQIWVLWGPDFKTGVSAIPPGVVQTDALGVNGVSFHDLNGDGLEDVVTWDRFKTSGFKGRVWILWAPTFDVFTWVKPQTTLSPFGEYGQTWDSGDVTGDGVVDLVLGNTKVLSSGCLFVYDGAAGFGGAPTYVLQPAGVPFTKWGYTVLVDDLDLDGSNEILTTQQFSPDLPPYSRLMYLNSLTGTDFMELYENINPTGFASNTSFYRSHFEDVNGDGFKDLVHSGDYPSTLGIGTPPHQDTTVMVRFGPAFTSSKMLCQPEPQNGSGFGYPIGIGDMNRDGATDIVAGAPHYHFSKFDWYSPYSLDGRFTIFFGPDFETEQVYDSEAPDAGVAWDIEIADMDGDGFAEILVGTPGASVVLRFQHKSLRPLTESMLSVSSGGSVPLSLECGKTSADEHYLILASASGSSPGVDLTTLDGPVHLPLNFDVLTTVAIQLANSPLLAGFQGQLDAAGEGLAVLNLPAGVAPPSAVGLTMTFAAVTFAPTGKIRYATHPVGVALTP